MTRGANKHQQDTEAQALYKHQIKSIWSPVRFLSLHERGTLGDEKKRKGENPQLLHAIGKESEKDPAIHQDSNAWSLMLFARWVLTKVCSTSQVTQSDDEIGERASASATFSRSINLRRPTHIPHLLSKG